VLCGQCNAVVCSVDMWCASVQHVVCNVDSVMLWCAVWTCSVQHVVCNVDSVMLRCAMCSMDLECAEKNLSSTCIAVGQIIVKSTTKLEIPLLSSANVQIRNT